MTGIDRRTLLKALGAGLLLPWLPAMATPGAKDRWLSARADEAGQFRVSGFDDRGQALFDLPLPQRGHSLTLHPTRRQAVIFARRPGTFARVIDLERGEVVAEIQSRPGRHFYGHGSYAPDGSLLYATENDFDGERGTVGIYDARSGYRRVGEFASHGIGPHDIRLLGDGTTLVIANGGILTHPDLPRVELNIPTMDPSLVYLDRRDGRRLGQLRLASELHQMSIRHLALGRDGIVAIALQDQGPAGRSRPLLALHRPGQSALRLAEAPDKLWRDMRQYGGSTAFDPGGGIVAVSSPRGGLVGFWEVTGRYLGQAPVTDGCGVAPGQRPGEFLVSSGMGGVWRIDPRRGSRVEVASAFLSAGHWDNHLVAVNRLA